MRMFPGLISRSRLAMPKKDQTGPPVVSFTEEQLEQMIEIARGDIVKQRQLLQQASVNIERLTGMMLTYQGFLRELKDLNGKEPV
jgi:hypothetical protein